MINASKDRLEMPGEAFLAAYETRGDTLFSRARRYERYLKRDLMQTSCLI